MFPLVVKSTDGGPPAAGFFFWRRGRCASNFGAFSFFEFPFDARKCWLRGNSLQKSRLIVTTPGATRYRRRKRLFRRVRRLAYLLQPAPRRQNGRNPSFGHSPVVRFEWSLIHRWWSVCGMKCSWMYWKVRPADFSWVKGARNWRDCRNHGIRAIAAGLTVTTISSCSPLRKLQACRRGSLLMETLASSKVVGYYRSHLSENLCSPRTMTCISSTPASRILPMCSWSSSPLVATQRRPGSSFGTVVLFSAHSVFLEFPFPRVGAGSLATCSSEAPPDLSNDLSVEDSAPQELPAEVPLIDLPPPTAASAAPCSRLSDAAAA